MLAGYDELLAAVERQRLYGVFSAQVTEVIDPDQQGRVKIRLPWSPDPDSGSYQVWARRAVLMAGNNRGTWFIPDVDDGWPSRVATRGGRSSSARSGTARTRRPRRWTKPART